jgi:hypothetical protein
MSDNTKRETVEKRSIRTADFRDKPAIAAAVEGKRTALGQIVGIVYDAKKKLTQQPDGSTRESTLLQGQFEATSFKAPADIIKSAACYMPAYFAEALASQLEKSGDGGVMFAVEIGMEPAEREGGVPYQYYVKNLIQPEPNDPLEALKRRVGGALKLPALPAPGAAPAAVTDETAATASGSNAGKGKGKAA